MRKVDELEEQAERLRQKKRKIVAALAVCLLGFSSYSWWSKTTPPQSDVSSSGAEVAEASRQPRGEIVVYVSGLVEHPGVIKLPAGSRVLDAVNVAGGLLFGAEVSKLNLAQPLRDGMQIHVPGTPAVKNDGISSHYQMAAGTGKNSSTPPGSIAPSDKININTATAAELDKLPGVGPAMAKRIVEWRQENGPFHSGEDLKQVKGIGDAKYQKLKDRISW